MKNPSIVPIEPHSPWIAEIAARQFAHWGPLTGFPSLAGYERFLHEAAASAALPRVLIAATAERLLGSVNLLAQEMTIRPDFTPWLGQLFVANDARGNGVGAALLAAAARHVRSLGYHRLFLFTSGRLPDYYRMRGWRDVEYVTYLGKLRTVMQLDLTSPLAQSR